MKGRYTYQEMYSKYWYNFHITSGLINVRVTFQPVIVCFADSFECHNKLVVHLQYIFYIYFDLFFSRVDSYDTIFWAMKNIFFLIAVNKSKLVESGCLDVILPLLTTQSPFVQFKVLGTLRMLVTGQGK